MLIEESFLANEIYTPKEPNKITALKWNELNGDERNLVLAKNVPNLQGESLTGYIELLKSESFYFDRLGNIYVYTKS